MWGTQDLRFKAHNMPFLLKTYIQNVHKIQIVKMTND